MFMSRGFAKPLLIAAVALLAPAAAEAQIGIVLPTVVNPVDDQRTALEGALTALQAVEAAGGYITVPDGPTLRLGDEGAAVALLDQRLRQSGDLQADRPDPLVFDDVLDEAVKLFQRRHGLEEDGIVGPRTMAQINESVADLVRRIQVNLQRLDDMPDQWLGRRIVVNLPGFSLTAYRDGLPELEMKVIVGRESRATPEMTSPITQLVINPTWTVPPTIMRQDIAPHMLSDPGYLLRRGLSVVSGGPPDYGGAFIDWAAVRAGYRSVGLRQAAGPGNPLGRIKFHMQNEDMIYLHDTNERHLFSRARRSVSSGCVRVADPLALAHFVAEGVTEPWERWMADPAWRTQWVTLPEPVYVSLVYHTVWVDEDGVLQVREDIYGHDRTDMIALADTAAAGG